MQDDESAISHTRLAYLPALDGIRACAVVAVMMFHGGIPHMDGRLHGGRCLLRPLGIPDHFAADRGNGASRSRSSWPAFWARRARRLLPALFLMLLFVAFFASVIVPRAPTARSRLDALATLLYVSNWHFILVGSNYFNETQSLAADPHLVAGGGGAVLRRVATRRPRPPAPHA